MKSPSPSAQLASVNRLTHARSETADSANRRARLSTHRGCSAAKLKGNLGLTALVLLGLIASPRLPLHAADSPTYIPFQGRLTDQAGNTYTNGQYTILFQLYNQPVGGQPIWLERHDKVGVINGLVNVFLGSITPLTNVTFDTTKHLGITIDADNIPNTPEPEMIPRQMIIPAFWAKNSEKLNGFDWGAITVGGLNNPLLGKIAGNKIETGGITSSQIADHAIASNHLVPGSVLGAILDRSVLAKQIALSTLTSNEIAPNAISFDRLALRQRGTNLLNGEIATSAELFDTSPQTGGWAPNELVVTLNASGRPVVVALVSSANPSASRNSPSYIKANANTGILQFLRDNIPVNNGYLIPKGDGIPASSFWTVDFLAQPGPHSYRVQFDSTDGVTYQAYRVRLIAFEL